MLTKYGLNVGDTYETQKELANKIGKSEMTIRQWRKKDTLNRKNFKKSKLVYI